MHATMQPSTATPHGTKIATHKRHSVREQPLPAFLQWASGVLDVWHIDHP